MAEEAPAKAGFDLVKTKIGPLPVIAWIGIGGVVFYLVAKQKKTSSGGTGAATDAAGNTGAIDPATGFVYGSPEDLASMHGVIGGGSSAGTDNSGGGGGGSSGAKTYNTNADWGRAAVNYLTGLGIDPTVATQSIGQYLSSQTLSDTQQGNVNLAIQALGPPPQLPPPSQTNPNPVGTNATNPVTGLTIDPRSTSPATLEIKWNAAANAKDYHVKYGLDAQANTWETDSPAGQTAVTIGGLRPRTTYYFQVQAQPAAPNAPYSEIVSGTTSGG
jgi:Fibronectin type III domain